MTINDQTERRQSVAKKEGGRREQTKK